MKYYLIGLPGSGKSTIGRELAHELKYKFIDTDKLIEGKYGNISNILKSMVKLILGMLNQKF